MELLSWGFSGRRQWNAGCLPPSAKLQRVLVADEAALNPSVVASGRGISQTSTTAALLSSLGCGGLLLSRWRGRCRRGRHHTGCVARNAQHSQVAVDAQETVSVASRSAASSSGRKKSAKLRLPRHVLMGDVAVLEPECDEVVAAERARALLESLPVRSVAMKETVRKTNGGIATRLKHIAGDPSLEIEYKECGLRFRIDLARRLSRFARSQGGQGERQRILQQVAPGERILVLGAGYGLSTCLLAKNSDCEEVLGIERNPIAHEFAVANIRLNRIQNKAHSQVGDPLQLDAFPDGSFSRVCAFLPFHDEDGNVLPLTFLAPALRVLKMGGTLHCYSFETEAEFQGAGASKAQEEIQQACPDGASCLMTWRGKVPRKSIGRKRFRVGMDFAVCESGSIAALREECSSKST